MPFDGTLKFDTAIDQNGFKAGIGSLGDIAKKGLGAIGGLGKTAGAALARGLEVTAGAVAAGTAAVAAIGKQALDAYADFEQLSGGVETLFGDAAQTVMENAAKAFQTAGMSANDYMETATASAAAMVSSLAGDTQKAAELTDMAVTDMADNINKMGTAAESVQNAYAGFAKGNFTMLDNLKLGYGGTKEEMQRLLDTAQTLTGVEYDISSYADIVQAIHAIQEQMGITGTTAREASSTISGSVAAMRSAWDNLLVGIADDTQDFDKLTNDLVTSAETAAGNILPRVETIAGGMVKLIGSLGDDAVRGLTDVLAYAPTVVDTGVQLISALVEGVTDNLPVLLASGKEMCLSLANGIIRSVPDLLDAANGITDGIVEAVNDPQLARRLARTGHTVLSALGEGLTRNLPLLLGAGLTVMQGLLEEFLDPEAFAALLGLGLTLLSMIGDSLMQNLPLLLTAGGEILMQLIGALSDPANLTALLDTGMQILTMLAGGIGDNLGELLAAAILVVRTLGVYLAEHAPELVTVGLELLTAVADAIFDNTDELLLAAQEIIFALWDALMDSENQQKLIDAGVELLTSLFNGLMKFGGEVLGFVSELYDRIWDNLTNMDWAELGRNLMRGMFNGLNNLDLGLLNEFKDNFLTGIKDIFGIHSPSRLMRDEVGRYLALGIGEGFSDNLPDLGSMAEAALDGMPEGVQIPVSLDVPELPELPEVPDIPVGFDVEDVPEVTVQVDVPDFPDMPDDPHDPHDPRFWDAGTLQVTIDPDALALLREMQQAAPPDAVAALRDVMPAIRESAAVPVDPAAISYVQNHYYDSRTSNSYQTTNQTAAPETPAPRGDIIIPVNIAGQNLDTVVVKAAQIANAQSGGVTL
jgi:phage-related protein